MKPTRLALSILAVFAAAATPALAQFKVVGPDGSVTYTDRPPPSTAGKSGLLQRSPQAGGAPETPLPLELRQAVQKYPVTLYSMAECGPCDAGRRLLQERGIPFTEKRMVSEEDAEALQRLTGARTVPSLTIGQQSLRGLADADWHSYLDAAGYPRENKLPRGYVQAPATPLVQRQAQPAGSRPTAAAPTGDVPAVSAPAGDPPAPPKPGSIRF